MLYKSLVIEQKVSKTINWKIVGFFVQLGVFCRPDAGFLTTMYNYVKRQNGHFK